jgi:xeroderma pigmentosum group C-complementing protein
MEDPVDLNDFKETAKTLSGSRDLGVQLFCALLRSVAVDTRLVCSLQPLPFSGVAKGITPEKPKPQYIHASSITHQTPYQDPPSTGNTASPSNPRWRASEFASEEHTPRAPPPPPPPPPPPTTPSSKKRIKDSPYPIFWTEVFSPSIDKWIPVDPLVRHTFNKPRTGYEPPASDRLNSMSYVVAFEDDTSARDVTRRYASQYNAKTRKLRVESTKGGEKWWRRTMKFFERPFPETRDEIEDNELVAREVQEGMPKSVGDFKGHPIFALERHLRRNEVIHPLREAGKATAGTGAKVEPVYRRRDVHVVRSADQWYRKGRDVKEGEQPLKRAVTRRSSRNTPMGEDEVGEDGTGLYAEFQTDVYVPPPAVDGKIPRNAYGNLDVYVPSMIPEGAIHLQHPIAARAAKILGVDYADAVTGFDFKGRQGTAVVNGIVAAEWYCEALVEVIRGLELERADAEQQKRTNLALQMWRRFMTALRIRDKINKEYADADSDRDMTDQTEDGNGSGDDGAGGGFVPDADTNEPDTAPFAAQAALMTAPLPFLPSEIIVIESPHKLGKPASEATPQKMTRFDSLFDEADAQDNGGGFPTEEIDHGDGGGFMPEEDGNGEGGGFIPEDAEDDQGGGFVPEEHTNEPSVTLAGRLNADLGVSSVSDAAHLEEGVEHTPRRLPLTVPTREPPGAALSPQAMAATSNGKIMLDTLEKPPVLVKETSTLSVKDIGSRRSPDSIDNESLLSHDPEDEDAEPEWLVDDEEL